MQTHLYSVSASRDKERPRKRMIDSSCLVRSKHTTANAWTHRFVCIVMSIEKTEQSFLSSQGIKTRNKSGRGHKSPNHNWWSEKKPEEEGERDTRYYIPMYSLAKAFPHTRRSSLYSTSLVNRSLRCNMRHETKEEERMAEQIIFRWWCIALNG